MKKKIFEKNEGIFFFFTRTKINLDYLVFGGCSPPIKTYACKISGGSISAKRVKWSFKNEGKMQTSLSLPVFRIFQFCFLLLTAIVNCDFSALHDFSK